MISGMPNLFISQGPRSFLGTQSAFFSIECQVDWITQVIARALLMGYRTVDVKPEAQKKFLEWYDKEVGVLFRKTLESLTINFRIYLHRWAK